MTSRGFPRALVCESRTPDPGTRLVTVCEYMRKLIENAFNYSLSPVEKTSIENKRDIRFGRSKMP